MNFLSYKNKTRAKKVIQLSFIKNKQNAGKGSRAMDEVMNMQTIYQQKLIDQSVSNTTEKYKN